MPRYRTTHLCSLPALYNAGVEIEYTGWPSKHGLEPLDDDARLIAKYEKEIKSSGALPDSPFKEGKLHLPETALPMWKLGPSYRARENDPESGEDSVLRRALGWHVMGGTRQSCCVFTTDCWPQPGEEVIPMNEPARQVFAYAIAHPGAPAFEKAWKDGKLVPYAATVAA